MESQPNQPYREPAGPAGNGQPSPGRPPVGTILIIGALSGIALGVLSIGMKKGGFLTTSDVGDLQDLAPIQSKLMPVDACEIDYATRDKQGRRDHLEVAFVTPCSESDRRVVIHVSSGWGRKGVGFQMKRRSQADRWKVIVEKDEVPFPELKGALEEVATTMTTSYAHDLEKDRAQSKAYEDGVKARRLEEEARKNGAKSSYPTH